MLRCFTVGVLLASYITENQYFRCGGIFNDGNDLMISKRPTPLCCIGYCRCIAYFLLQVSTECTEIGADVVANRLC